MFPPYNNLTVTRQVSPLLLQLLLLIQLLLPLQQPPPEVLARGLEAVKLCFEVDNRVLIAQAR